MSLYDKFPDLLDENYVKNYQWDDCWTVSPENAKGSYEELDVAVALITARGNYSTVARILGKSRRSVENFVLRNVDLRDLQEDLEEEFIDEIEFLYRDDARNGDTNARKFFLTTKGRNRGYVTRNEASGPDGKPIEVEMTNVFDISKMTLDEINTIEKLLLSRANPSEDEE